MIPVVAVIDSGIDKEYYYKNPDIFVDTVSCVERELGNYHISKIFPRDLNGHGTMVVDMIRALNSKCKFLVVKILNSECLATTEMLATALEYLKKQPIDVIHMSIAVTKKDEQFVKISQLCNDLNKQGKMIVCSVENGKDESFPAELPSVFGVSGCVFNCCTNFYLNMESCIQFLCDATPSLVTGLKGELYLFSGNSKAACAATAKIASIENYNYTKGDKDLNILLWDEENTDKFHFIVKGEIPYIRENRKINLSSYEWCATDILNDFCQSFLCDKNKILKKRLIDVCDNLSGEMFSMFFLCVEKRLNLDLRASVLHYADFEWISCLFDYIDKEYKKRKGF